MTRGEKIILTYMPGMLLGFLYAFFAGVQSEGEMCLIALFFPIVLQIIIFSLSEFGYLSDWEWSWGGCCSGNFFYDTFFDSGCDNPDLLVSGKRPHYKISV